MVRRSFRVGLRLGLLAGVIVALAKVVQSRRTIRDDSWMPPPADPWPPLQPDPVTVEPPAATMTERIPPLRRASAEPATAPPAPPAPVGPTAAATRPGAAAPPAAAPSPARVEGAEMAADHFDSAAGTLSPSAGTPVPTMTPASPVDETPEPARPASTVPAMAPAPPADETPAPTEATAPSMPPSPPIGASADPPPTLPVPAASARPAKRVAKAVRKAAKVVPVRTDPSATTTPVAPAPAKARVRKARPQSWVEPLGSDAPTSHPVKAKLSSMLYHLPGMAFYNRTKPDRCYIDDAAAEADGFIRAKR